MLQTKKRQTRVILAHPRLLLTDKKILIANTCIGRILKNKTNPNQKIKHKKFPETTEFMFHLRCSHFSSTVLFLPTIWDILKLVLCSDTKENKKKKIYPKMFSIVGFKPNKQKPN